MAVVPEGDGTKNEEWRQTMSDKRNPTASRDRCLSEAGNPTNGHRPPKMTSNPLKSRYQASPEEQAESARKYGNELVVVPLQGDFNRG